MSGRAYYCLFSRSNRPSGQQHPAQQYYKVEGRPTRQRSSFLFFAHQALGRKKKKTEKKRKQRSPPNSRKHERRHINIPQEQLTACPRARSHPAPREPYLVPCETRSIWPYPHATRSRDSCCIWGRGMSGLHAVLLCCWWDQPPLCFGVQLLSSPVSRRPCHAHPMRRSSRSIRAPRKPRSGAALLPPPLYYWDGSVLAAAVQHRRYYLLYYSVE